MKFCQVKPSWNIAGENSVGTICELEVPHESMGDAIKAIHLLLKNNGVKHTYTIRDKKEGE